MHRAVVLLAVAAGVNLSLAASPGEASPPPEASPPQATSRPQVARQVARQAYDQSVAPLLRKFCFDCHGPGVAEGGWSLSDYAGFDQLLADKATWSKARQLLESHVMPPGEQTQPTLPQRRTILRWIDDHVFYVDPQRPDPGHTTLRRLNRAEYNNTLRDILGVTTRPADQFPPDDSGYGFDNIGDVLSLSPLHLEKYLIAARQAAAEAVRLEALPRLGVERTVEKIETFAGKPAREEAWLELQSPRDRIGVDVEVPVAGTYKIFMRGRGRGTDEGDLLQVLCDDQPLTPFKLSDTAEGSRRLRILEDLPAGPHRISLRLPETGGPQVAEVSFLGVAGPFAPLPREVSPYLGEHFGTRVLAPAKLRLSGEDLESGSGRSSLDTVKSWFATNGYRHAPVRLAAEGRYRFRFLVGAQQAGDEPVRFEVRIADRGLGPFDVTAGAQSGQWIETEVDLPPGEHDLQIWFTNEFTDPESGAERWLWVHEFSLEGPLEAVRPLKREEVAATLRRTARQLFRRPLDARQSDRIGSLVEIASNAQPTPLAALRTGLEGLLVSPQFLFHPRPEPAGNRRNGTADVDSHTLASRLSYFLWSSAPDEKLRQLAERGQLREQLESQVRRMLDDPRAKALTRNFAGQWLQLRNLAQAAPDPRTFPDFDPRLLADMRRESELLFEHVLRENRPVTDFLKADYTFVNQRLARHYGLPDVPQGDSFERVSLDGTERGGILTHGSILTLTSHPTRTSPVKRGKWLLEQLLGTPPPPAPADVPPLPDTRENVNLPLRQRLEQHRSHAACASCHAFLDPMGMALENYDAVGRWRTQDENQPIDASGQLVTGERFDDAAQLRKLLVDRRRDAFQRCLAEHLLTYALGRGVSWRDKPAVQEIVRKTEADDGRFQSMILAVCQSVPFQRMRADDLEPLEPPQNRSGE